MATELNACPTCNEMVVYYDGSFNNSSLSEISLSGDIRDRLSIKMPVHISNGGEILILYPLMENMIPFGTCAYIFIGNIGSTSWGIKFGTCSFDYNNSQLLEFTSSNVIDIY